MSFYKKQNKKKQLFKILLKSKDLNICILFFFLTVANESWGTHQNHPQSAKFQGTDGGF